MENVPGDAARDRILSLLASVPATRPIEFWWRDDDAETATPALDRLLKLARRHELPLELAVVPKRATEELAERLAPEPKVFVLQHGWSHRNHAAEGGRKIELGDERPLFQVIGQLSLGFDGLTRLFPAKFLPVLVPPWNRISDSVREALPEMGLVGLSTAGPAPPEPHRANVHLDILVWRPQRRTKTRAEIYAALATELERRLAGDAEPIGIMTHHIVHDEASWALLDELFGLIAKHPAAKWPPVEEVFGLTKKLA